MWICKAGERQRCTWRPLQAGRHSSFSSGEVCSCSHCLRAAGSLTVSGGSLQCLAGVAWAVAPWG